mmetsp:Transcript_65714/g.182946  ORF Transcript_65714/g.182946 Transcript_65714/m.182946 type:complete len:85 (+) Transcript_65714:283-537(+)
MISQYSIYASFYIFTSYLVHKCKYRKFCIVWNIRSSTFTLYACELLAIFIADFPIFFKIFSFCFWCLSVFLCLRCIFFFIIILK